MADGRWQAGSTPPARTDYPFEIKESLQLLDDGKHVLVADQYSIWLLNWGLNRHAPRVVTGKLSFDILTGDLYLYDAAKHPSKSVEPCAGI